MSAKKLFLIFFLFSSAITYSQSINVRKETTRINSEIADGYEIMLEATEEEVQNSLSKFLKSVGKSRESAGVLTIHEPLISGKKYTNALYSTSRQMGNLTSAWIGIHTKDWGDEASGVEKDLEKLIYDFGVSFHRDKIQKQIDESVRALQAVEKQQQRLVNQNKDLTNKVEDNRREKIQLEKSLENNKIEFVTLTRRLEQNKKAQDSVAVATEQIKKVVEMHKERQSNVN